MVPRGVLRAGMTGAPPTREELSYLLQFAEGEERQILERAFASIGPSYIDERFPAQRAFILDSARFKAIIGPRRMGKSNTLARVLCKRGAEYPAGGQGAASIYIGLTAKQARLSFWEPALKPLLNSLGVDAHFNEQEMICTLPNGHVIYVMGMESTSAIKDRIRGGGYATVVIDEAATFVLSLDGIFSSVIRAAVADVLGWVIFAGTPGFIRLGLFWRVTKGHNEARATIWDATDKDTATSFRVFRWTAAENPYMAQQLASELGEMLVANPDAAELPAVRREAFGLWVVDDTGLCYRFASERNEYEQLPALHANGWHRVLSCDLGYHPDPTAMTVSMWHDHDPTLFYDYACERLGLLDDGIVAWVRELERHYGRFERYIIDGAEVRTVEEMRRRDDIPWEAADKRGKSDFIELMNSDLVLGLIKIHATRTRWEATDTIECSSLAEEFTSLVWSKKALERGKREEDPDCANHATDASLYGWRMGYHYASKKPGPPKPLYGSREHYAQEEAGRLALALQNARRRRDEQESANMGDPWAAENQAPAIGGDF